MSDALIKQFSTMFLSLCFLETPVVLSKAPCLPDFNQLTTYFVAFQLLSGGPLIPTIMLSPTEAVNSLFRAAE
jgi:hypothetical protein